MPVMPTEVKYINTKTMPDTQGRHIKSFILFHASINVN